MPELGLVAVPSAPLAVGRTQLSPDRGPAEDDHGGHQGRHGATHDRLTCRYARGVCSPALGREGRNAARLKSKVGATITYSAITMTAALIMLPVAPSGAWRQSVAFGWPVPA